MISYVRGNLFESPAQTLVNTVNTVGVMGKGIALKFKTIYPDMFAAYRDLCERGDLSIGRLHIWRTPHKVILNFPTKKDWRSPSKPEYIRQGLETFVQSYEAADIHSVAFPPLGCGNGELDFDRVVRPIMHERLKDLPITVYIYTPHPRRQRPEHRTPETIKNWLRSKPEDLPFGEVWDDLRGVFARKKTLRTLSRRSAFEVQYSSEDDVDGLRIWASKTMFVAREEFFDLWEQLRSGRILTSGTAPSNRSKDASYLLPVLGELPYVDAIWVGEDYETFQVNPIMGLQLAAHEPRPAQLQLV
jgi:O-acetyl-ADP-ribose deacetylase (regulator of RNase III)